MKKIFLLLILLMLPLVGAVTEAPDLSDQAVFTAEVSKKEILRLTDRKLNTVWQGPRGKGTLAIHSPTPCHGLYVCWNQSPRAFRIEVLQGGGGRPAQGRRLRQGPAVRDQRPNIDPNLSCIVATHPVPP